MTDISREDRQERIARDDGDPDDEVITSTNSANTIVAYHDDPGCPNAKAIREHSRTTLSRAAAQARGRTPCKECVLEEVDRSANANRNGGGKSDLEVLIDAGEVPDDLLGAGWSA